MLNVMDQNIGQPGSNESKGNVQVSRKGTTNGEKSNKCNQCDYATSQASTLKKHLKTHSGDKSNKCNQCDFASSRADTFRTHLKTHTRQKLNKCNQCDFASIQSSNLRAHLKMHLEKSQTNVMSVTLDP